VSSQRRDRVRGSGVDARDSRAALPEETLAILTHRAEEALATERVERTRLGYEVLVKLKLDELLEREDFSADVSAPQGNPDTTTVES
jgi:hypothetical protein